MLNSKSRVIVVLVALALVFALAACGGTAPAAVQEQAAEVVDQAQEAAAEVEAAVEEPVAEVSEAGTGLASDAAVVASEFFSQEQYDRSMEQMTMTPEGPDGHAVGANAAILSRCQHGRLSPKKAPTPSASRMPA